MIETEGESIWISREEECEIIRSRPIEIAKYDYATGPKIRTKCALAEEKDELGGNQYMENREAPTRSK